MAEIKRRSYTGVRKIIDHGATLASYSNMSEFDQPQPQFSGAEVLDRLRLDYGLSAELSPLVSERDQNFRVDAGGQSYVLKISNLAEDRAFLKLQTAVLTHLQLADPTLAVPRVVPALDGSAVVSWQGSAGTHAVRLLSYLPGRLLSTVSKSSATLASLGAFMGRLSRALKGFGHPAAHRQGFLWNLDEVLKLQPWLADIATEGDRAIATRLLARYQSRTAPRLPRLRAAVLHQDANDNNLLVDADGEVCGLIDFGDMSFGRQINELAITLAYALLDEADLQAAALPLIAAYAAQFPLEAEEADALFDLLAMRLVASVCISSRRSREFPDNDYLTISQAPALRLLARLDQCDPDQLAALARSAAGFGDPGAKSSTPEADSKPLLRPSPENHQTDSQSVEALRQRRAKVLGPSLSLSYRHPLKIVRGRGAYLYDHSGRAYVDGVNNICHVGHCHPHVVQAQARQAAQLNTNTRYLHDTLIDYAERLTAKFAQPLSVLYMMCSGTEANELALRIARTVTGRRHVLTLDWGYHGNTGGLIDVSPYKFNRKGGSGKPEQVEIAMLPDPYRGPYKGYGSDSTTAYVRSVTEKLALIREHTGTGPAAFIAEAISGCGGQIMYPQGYLGAAAREVRAAGGLVIIDEVQTGFGRVGSHWWAHQLQDVVPDIVTLGKPIGNGHPMAAVITTPEIARAFANGMEFFSSFGGNPVSTAIGMAVLDVIENEHLLEHATSTGAWLKTGLEALAERFALIGDVRGTGLFLGVELVRDRSTLEPATTEAADLINHAREQGVLLSTDGPMDNVIKIKPPMVFGRTEADLMLEVLESGLRRMAQRGTAG